MNDELPEESLYQVARNLPQFDVPESLTQRIMQNVAVQQQVEPGLVAGQRLPLLLLATVLVLTLESADSLSGLLSWCVAMTVMTGLKWLVKPEVVMEGSI